MFHQLPATLIVGPSMHSVVVNWPVTTLPSPDRLRSASSKKYRALVGAFNDYGRMIGAATEAARVESRA